MPVRLARFRFAVAWTFGGCGVCSSVCGTLALAQWSVLAMCVCVRTQKPRLTQVTGDSINAIAARILY